MRSHFIVSLLLALGILASHVEAQDLQIKGGDVRIVEVDRIIVIKDKVRVVSTFPFTINAPAADPSQVSLYSWDVPPGFTVTKKDHVLTVITAPKGSATISVTYVFIETEPKLKVTKQDVSITFAVGEPGPGPPPGPLPDPPDAFTKSLQDAYKVETNPEKAKIVAFFASLYRSVARNDVKDQSLSTLGDLYARLVSARKREYPDDEIILPIRKLIEAELNLLVGTKTTKGLDEETRSKAAAAFNRIAASLEAIK